jgi:hypothetical protein
LIKEGIPKRGFDIVAIGCFLAVCSFIRDAAVDVAIKYLHCIPQIELCTRSKFHPIRPVAPQGPHQKCQDGIQVPGLNCLFITGSTYKPFLGCPTDKSEDCFVGMMSVTTLKILNQDYDGMEQVDEACIAFGTYGLM